MNRGFAYRAGRLCVEQVSLEDIAARFGTPVYVYSRSALCDAFDEYHNAFAGERALVCFAVKANSGRAVLATLAARGAGFDIVSGGELERVLAAGGPAERIVFSGIGKSEMELRQALNAGIRAFNVESGDELDRLNAVALDAGRQAPVCLRLNPDVNAGGHRYISTGGLEHKFGVPADACLELARQAQAAPGLAFRGLACHIGSQIFREAAFGDAADFLIAKAAELTAHGIPVASLDFGGGLGVATSRDKAAPPSRQRFVAALLERLPAELRASTDLLIEPGRSIVADSGALLTRVEYLKHGGSKAFAVVDAAMNDLLRPSLYDAWHDIVPVTKRPAQDAVRYDVVGPVCETGDFLGHDRDLAVERGDLLAVLQAGAYGASMSSTYNSRPRAAEVMVDGAVARLVRRRERVADLMAGEAAFEDEMS
ncbi:MAG: diaminopimelate decarboxylase [Pseudomonadota bacterium]